MLGVAARERGLDPAWTRPRCDLDQSARQARAGAEPRRRVEDAL